MLKSGVYVFMCFLVLYKDVVEVNIVLNGFCLVGILVILSGMNEIYRYGFVGNFVVF